MEQIDVFSSGIYPRIQLVLRILATISLCYFVLPTLLFYPQAIFVLLSLFAPFIALIFYLAILFRKIVKPLYKLAKDLLLPALLLNFSATVGFWFIIIPFYPKIAEDANSDILHAVPLLLLVCEFFLDNTKVGTKQLILSMVFHAVYVFLFYMPCVLIAFQIYPLVDFSSILSYVVLVLFFSVVFVIGFGLVKAKKAILVRRQGDLSFVPMNEMSSAQNQVKN